MKVLIVEDSMTQRVMLQTIISQWGFDTVQAENGQQAWRILSDVNAPRLVLMDWEMPELDGLEVCRRIRKRDIKDPAYILLLTSRRESADIVAGLEAGANDYITKPFNNAELQARLEVGRRMLNMQRELIGAYHTLTFRANHDELTELPNRLSFKNRIEQAVVYAKQSGRCFSVMFIDLDGFKHVNDSLGHSAGDKLLQTLALRLKNTLRTKEFAARFGGDEFCVLIEDVIDPISVSHIAQRCLKVLERSTHIDSHEIFPRASIGISIYPHDGKTPEVLLQCADNAMYAAKAAGKHQFIFYNKDMIRLAEQRFTLEKDLRKAIKSEEFELYYQPQITLDSGKLIAVEALIRWHHPERGMIPPDEFIPIAENIGMIIPLGVWVLNQACKQMAEWRESSIPVNYVAINISSIHFCDVTLPSDVLLALANTGIKACDIELEITESVMQTGKDGIRNFQAIKDFGIKLAIDDFGTGYSCLASLTELPIDSLKIDRAFIQDVLGDKSKATIVATIIAMSRALGFSVVAEGAETIEQVNYLQSVGCDTVQGYYFSKPVPAEQIPMLAATEFLNCKNNKG